MEVNFKADIDAINHIDAVPTILEVVCRTTGMGFAAVARVTETRWVACAVRDEIAFGLVPGGELAVDKTLCHEIRQHKQAIVISDLVNDKKFSDHPVPNRYDLQSYISVPIMTKSDEFFGTLCAIDPHPAAIDQPETLNMFNLFADLIAFHLHAIAQLKAKELQLIEAHKTAILRDKFITILGHDLRNPIGAILNVSELLLRMTTDERVKRLAVIVQNSSHRMKSLIDNILDFAHGQLGEGIKLNLEADISLEQALKEVLTEIQLIHPEVEIDATFKLEQKFSCDPARLAQVLSNLLSNAITHGKKNEAVKLRVYAADGVFRLSVCNQGEQISERVMKRLFQPFYRGAVGPKQHGLGLGLYIVAEIAKAHQGKIEVESDELNTRFTLIIDIVD